MTSPYGSSTAAYTPTKRAEDFYQEAVRSPQANRTHNILFKKELWVPSNRTGGATPAGSRWVGLGRGKFRSRADSGILTVPPLGDAPTP